MALRSTVIRYGHSLVVNSQGPALRPGLAPALKNLGEEHFAMLAPMAPELVLFGSGEPPRFPRPQWLQGLYLQRIGVEAMDTQAACRTFNVLAGEGRRVVAVLLVLIGQSGLALPFQLQVKIAGFGFGLSAYCT